MSPVERILLELESATSVAATPTEDLGAAREAMDRRQRAIEELSRLTGVLHALPQGERVEALRRLRLVSDAGAKAGQCLEAVKCDIIAEWNQWSHIYRALGAASASKPTLVDYKC